MKAYKERVGLDPVGPGAYDDEQLLAGLDFLSTHQRRSLCRRVPNVYLRVIIYFLCRHTFLKITMIK